MSNYLTIADLKTLYLATFETRTKWRNILLVLDISPGSINNIGTKWQDNLDDCYREGLSEWLKCGERSWEDVVKALSSPIVGFSDIARTIEKDYVQSQPENKNHQKINDDLTVFVDQGLGSGAFGAVFKGSYKGEICAAKILLHDAMEMRINVPMGKSEEASKAFDRECDFLELLQHPNVVQYVSTAKHPKTGGTILVVELMDCNLRSYILSLNEKSLTSECEISLSKDMACGLAYIHSKQIIHRDLCSDNILLKLTRPVPVAKISDFGMSRLYDPSKFSHTLTTIGHRMGYLPLEATRMDKEKYDNSVDVFSLGAIMVQIVCKLHTIKSAEDRSFHVAQIPHTHELRKIIDSCLQEDMRGRPSAEDIYASLNTDSEYVDTSKEVLSSAAAGSSPVSKLDSLPGELRPSLPLEWREGTSMPIGMSYEVHSVAIGDAVYVGGGEAGNDGDDCTVMKLKQDQWTKLPEYSAKHFAMTSLANRLVLVGGDDPRNNIRSNQLAVFESAEWTHPYPPMKIARYSPTAVSFNNHIIVAGGCNHTSRRTSSVEVLDVESKIWYTAQSLPKKLSHMRSTLIGNTLYLMGGYNLAWRNKTVYHVDLDKLIAKAKAFSKLDTPTIWQTIQDTPLELSAPLSIGRSLLAVGGRNDKDNSSSSIHLYKPDTRRWVKVGDLPSARFNCACSVLPSGEVIVAGGRYKHDSNTPSNTPSLYISVIST